MSAPPRTVGLLERTDGSRKKSSEKFIRRSGRSGTLPDASNIRSRATHATSVACCTKANGESTQTTNAPASNRASQSTPQQDNFQINSYQTLLTEIDPATEIRFFSAPASIHPYSRLPDPPPATRTGENEQDASYLPYRGATQQPGNDARFNKRALVETGLNKHRAADTVPPTRNSRETESTARRRSC